MLTTTPCADCGTTGGYIHPNGVKPVRRSGERYGITGTICTSCFRRHDKRVHPERWAGSHKALTVAVACADCKSTDGFREPNQGRPRRRKGKPFGIEGMLCHKCYFKHYSRVKLAKAAPVTVNVESQSPKRLTAEQARLAEENRGLAYKAALKYRNLGMDFDDLVGEGQLGLLHACVGFDPGRGNKFSTYATWCIWGAIKHALTHKSRTIRLSAEQQAKLNESEGGSHLAIAEGQLGWSLASIPEDRSADPSDNREAVEMAVAGLGTLPERSATVLRLRFGIGGEEQTLREIADGLGVSKERVRQIEAAALKKLRKQVGVAS